MGRWGPRRMAGAGAVRQPRSPGGSPNGSPDSQSSTIQPLFAKMRPSGDLARLVHGADDDLGARGPAVVVRSPCPLSKAARSHSRRYGTLISTALTFVDGEHATEQIP